MNKIDLITLRTMIASAEANLKNNRKVIDDLNIFPVPDGDTGTNMSLTFSGAAGQTLAEEYDGCGKMASKLASAALRNARGNSGVILSQIIRGFAKSVDGKKTINSSALAEALISAKNTAYRAVMKPTEGTILTVIREMAEFAEENASDFPEVDEFLRAILDEGKKSLENTTNLLPALKKAGVVDAGGKGLIALIEGAVYVLDNGTAIEGAEPLETTSVSKSSATADADIKFMYCTEFIINKTNERPVAEFRASICEKGDCMLVIEDDEIVKVHIHTNHPGFVLEQAVKFGELTNLKIENMKYQHQDNFENSAQDAPEDDDVQEVAKAQKPFGFAAVAAGEGIGELFRELGADTIIQGGQTMNPSTQDLLSAVNAVPAETVFILPNNKNIILSAEQVIPLTEKKVVVLPTKHIPQGIAAIASFDEEMSAEDNTAAMMDAAGMVACGQVTFAARDTILDGVDIHFGDCLGICGKEITAVTRTPEDAAVKVVEGLMNEDAGVITVYYGDEITEADAGRLSAQLEELYGDMDINVVNGGQPVYYYLLSVE